MISEIIEKKLNRIFKPNYLKVLNNSNKHNVPFGSESHFKVVIVSDLFIGKRVLERHRAIYKELSLEILNKIHALELHTYTLKEWRGLKDTLLTPSINCIKVI